MSDIPNGPHWAIIKTVSVTIPGDERSRTNPGHGYPAHTEEFITYKAFIIQSEWEEEIEKLTMRGERFTAIKASVAKVKVTVWSSCDDDKEAR